MFTSTPCVIEALGHPTVDSGPGVKEVLAQVRQQDRWVFSRMDATKVDFRATLSRFKALFDCICGAQAGQNLTLAKLLTTAIFIAIGRRNSPVWFEAAIVFRTFVRLCQSPTDYDRCERRFLRSFSAFQRGYMRGHMLAASQASQVLDSLQSELCACDISVDYELETYCRLPQPPASVSVNETWPGPADAEWQDVSLMTWLYGPIYDVYAEAANAIMAAGSASEAGKAVDAFSEFVGSPKAEPVTSVLEARSRLDELMQTYVDTSNAQEPAKQAQGATGSGSVLGFVEYLKNRELASNVVMEYFVNVVCQFPTFESTQNLPETMRRVALRVLQLQVQLQGLIDSSQLSDTAHELYARLEEFKPMQVHSPKDAWINAVLALYQQFMKECGPGMEAINSAVHAGRV